MYSSKHKVHSKADLGHLSIHTSTPGKKNEYGAARDKNSRFEGQQFSLPRQNAMFGTFEYQVKGKRDEYMSRNSYKDAPKKLGFGSSEPPKRDEFSNTIAIEQYRETIRSVNQSAAKMAKKAAPIDGGDQDLPGSVEEEKEEVFEYDQAHSAKQDQIGTVRTWKPLNHGTMRTTNANYGADCDGNIKGGRHGRTTCTSQFFNNNHLTVGDEE